MKIEFNVLFKYFDENISKTNTGKLFIFWDQFFIHLIQQTKNIKNKKNKNRNLLKLNKLN